ncbi:MAG: D-alanyl-D-alanine carboxypeptidase [Spirochaetales bacterium]|nr:D-alanyl-D-alanine carboxypeptidase [Spirochaetales bacterium]
MAVLLLLAAFPLCPDSFPAPPPVINAAAAVLVDLSTGTTLYEKAPDLVIPPASLTKLMSLHLAYQMIEEGLVSPDSPVPISAAAAFQNSPPGSSLMFLEEGQRATLLDIMRGLAIPSGNDSGIALAEFLAGTEGAFVERMNQEARRLGLTRTRFEDSSGYSAGNATTAGDFARFCAYYIQAHPAALAELHSLESFTYPRQENLNSRGRSARGSLTQYNHNSLVGRVEGVDGLKTGFIDESGYNLALTAQRGDRRLLAVLLGGPERIRGDGDMNRSLDGAVLLTYGFSAFESLTPRPPEISLRVYQGERKYLPLRPEALPRLTLDRSLAAGLSFQYELETGLSAPLEPGTPAGVLHCFDGEGRRLFTTRLLTAEAARPGGFWRRLWDGIRLFFTRKTRINA